MTRAPGAARDALTAVAGLRLEGFSGLAPGTTRADVTEALGPPLAEGFGGGKYPLWLTVHEIAPGVRITAWYRLNEEAEEPGVGPDHPVLWIDRPIVPGDVGQLDAMAGHTPPRAPHLKAWPGQGFGLRFSRRSRLPTLLYAFTAMSVAQFDASPIAGHD
jgi:hypothetical protein